MRLGSYGVLAPPNAARAKAGSARPQAAVAGRTGFRQGSRREAIAVSSGAAPEQGNPNSILSILPILESCPERRGPPRAGRSRETQILPSPTGLAC